MIKVLTLTHEGCPNKRDIKAVALELKHEGELRTGIMKEWECPCGIRILTFEPRNEED